MSKFGWPKRQIMRSGLRGNIVQGFDFYRADKGIIMLPAVLAIEGKGMINEPDFRVVLFQLGHSQDNRIMGQLRHEKLDFLAIIFSF
jgi:hypothetical protein